MCQKHTALEAELVGVLRPRELLDVDHRHEVLEPLFEKVFGSFFELLKFPNTIFAEIDINPLDVNKEPYSPENDNSNYLTFRIILRQIEDKWVPVRVVHINNETKQFKAAVWYPPENYNQEISTTSLQTLKDAIAIYIKTTLPDILGKTFVRDSTRWTISALLLTAAALGVYTKYPKEVHKISSQIAATLHPRPIIESSKK